MIITGTNGTPGADYAVLTATNQFSTAGAFSFTNPIVREILQRFFQLRTA